MTETANIINYGASILTLIFYIFIFIKYFQYWRRIKQAFAETGTTWPFHSREELQSAANRNLNDGYPLMFGNMGSTFRILFMKTDNPVILKPLRGIRRTFLAFILYPFILALVLIVVVAFLA